MVRHKTTQLCSSDLDSKFKFPNTVFKKLKYFSLQQTAFSMHLQKIVDRTQYVNQRKLHVKFNLWIIVWSLVGVDVFGWRVYVIVANQFSSCGDSFGRLQLCNMSHATECMRLCTNKTIVASQMNHLMIWIGWQQRCKHVSRIRLLTVLRHFLDFL